MANGNLYKLIVSWHEMYTILSSFNECHLSTKALWNVINYYFLFYMFVCLQGFYQVLSMTSK